MIDWYNFIVQHNPTPEGYKTGKGSAYETPLRDKTHGRIYRIVAKDGKPSERPRLSKDDPAGLVAALKNDNMFWRLHAQRLLVERGKDDVAADLAKLVADPSVDAVGLNPGAIHAMWTLTALDGWRKAGESGKAALAAAVHHRSAGVRRNAALALPTDLLRRAHDSGRRPSRRPRASGAAGGSACGSPTSRRQTVIHSRSPIRSRPAGSTAIAGLMDAATCRRSPPRREGPRLPDPAQVRPPTVAARHSRSSPAWPSTTPGAGRSTRSAP